MNALLEAQHNITQRDIDKVIAWQKDSGIYMVYPSDDLETVYNNYANQPKNDRRKADWEALDIYGIDNDTLYTYLKQNNDHVYKVDPDVDTSSTMPEVDREVKWEFAFSPFFSPSEINSLRGFYSDSVDEQCVNMGKAYSDYFNGLNNEFNILEWDDMVKKLQYKLSITDDETKFKIKENLLAIGWNPEVKYCPENQIKSLARLQSIINEEYKDIHLYDATKCYNEFDGNSSYVIEAASSEIYPIHIVLVRGNNAFSDLTVALTNGPFSHAALCPDNDFSRLYSFNLNNQKINRHGGFSLESIENYPKENNIGVYTFFVNKKQKDSINNTIQYMLYNIKNTSYSTLNLLSLPFSKINLNMTNKQICSQFVDKTLKLANIDLTNISSDKVTPNDLYRMTLKNSKIYKTYEGPAKNFNPKKASKYVNKLQYDARLINEANLLMDEEVILTELKSIIQINHKGDVLINKPYLLKDFNEEYYNSHKLLLQYEKTGDVEGMKYELAKLYYINYLLEKRIYNSKYKSSREENIKTRARVLNDFNKYMTYVLKKEPDFNFAKYYEQSPFCHDKLEIDAQTVKYFKDILKYKMI